MAAASRGDHLRLPRATTTTWLLTSHSAISEQALLRRSDGTHSAPTPCIPNRLRSPKLTPHLAKAVIDGCVRLAVRVLFAY